MTEEREREIEAICKEIHGLQIKYKDEFELDAIVLASRDKGISIKPMDTPEEVERVIVKTWGLEEYALVYDNDFCFMRVSRWRDDGAEKWILASIRQGVMDCSTIDKDLFFPGLNPSCPF